MHALFGQPKAIDANVWNENLVVTKGGDLKWKPGSSTTMAGVEIAPTPTPVPVAPVAAARPIVVYATPCLAHLSMEVIQADTTEQTIERV
jgi:hypothetical protein